MKTFTMSAVDPSPLNAAPLPPQPMAMPSLQVDCDDDILMDYEDETITSAPSMQTGDSVMMDVDDISCKDNAEDIVDAIDTNEVIVSERVHLRGVDNLNTAQIREYIAEHVPHGMVRLEWIDDTSCNILYDTASLAIKALQALQHEPKEFPLLHPRKAKPFSKSPESCLLVRISKPTDRKEKGARERSRYYLLHPEEDPAERKERDRRRAPGRTDRSRDRGDYSRRYYDSQEDARRKNDSYVEDFYDDDSSARSRQRQRRSRSRSPNNSSRYSHRSREQIRSSSLRRRSRRRSKSPLELFPERTSRTRGVELFPQRTRSTSQPNGSQKSKELFPERVNSKIKTAAMDSYQSQITLSDHNPTIPRQKPVELFPLRSASSNTSKTIELFPQKHTARSLSLYTTDTDISQTKNYQKSSRLADRIVLPPRGLAERINLPPSPESSPSNMINGKDLRFKGVVRGNDGICGASDDLFARKMMSAKGQGLVSDKILGFGGDGGRRRGRTKADEFM